MNIRLHDLNCSVISPQLSTPTPVCLFIQAGQPSLVCVTFLCFPLYTIPSLLFPVSWPVVMTTVTKESGGYRRKET